MLKNPMGMKEILCRHNSAFPSLLSASLIDDSAGRIARELWWTNQEFFPADIISATGCSGENSGLLGFKFRPGDRLS
jgi:hypothetical protein